MALCSTLLTAGCWSSLYFSTLEGELCKKDHVKKLSKNHESVFGLPHLLLSGQPELVQRSHSDSQTLRVAGLLLYSTRPTTAHCTEEGRHKHYTQRLMDHSDIHVAQKNVLTVFGYWHVNEIPLNLFSLYEILMPAPTSTVFILHVCMTIFYFLWLLHLYCCHLSTKRPSFFHNVNHIFEGLKVLKNSQNLSKVSEVVKM